jgi:Protein of unknown function (DUF1759)
MVPGIKERSFSSTSVPVSTRTRSKLNLKGEIVPPILRTTLEFSIKRSKVKSKAHSSSPVNRQLVEDAVRSLIPTPLPHPPVKIHFGPASLQEVQLGEIIRRFSLIMTDKENLTSDITRLFGLINRINTKLDSHQPNADPPVLLTEFDLPRLFERMSEASKSLQSIETQTYRLYSEQEVNETHGQFVFGLEENLDVVYAKANSLKTSFESQKSSSSLIKRKAIDLPQFNGDSSNWAEFKDQFDAAFHNDKSLPDSVKLQNLKNLMVKGSPPSQILSGFTITNENYAIAYQELTSRYEKKRELFFSYMDSIQALSQLKNQGGLQNMIDTMKSTMQKIQTLGMPTETWSPVMVYYIYRLLDPSSRREVEKAYPQNSVPKFEDVLKTLLPLAIAHDAARVKSSFSHQSLPEEGNRQTHSNNNGESSSSSASSTNQKDGGQKCFICKSRDHWSVYCEVLRKLPTVSQRLKLLREKKLCEKCVNEHPTTSCRRNSKCRTPGCAETHLQFLCPLNCSSSQPVTPSSSFSSSSDAPKGREILPTALVHLLDENGEPILFRGLVDGCSQISIISENAMSLLRIPRKKSNVTIIGTGVVESQSKGATRITVRSLQNPNWEGTVDFQIIPRVAKQHPDPTSVVKADQWFHLSALQGQLADPTFSEPGKVDFILSSGVYSLIKKKGLIKGEEDEPIAESTELGWLVFGSTTTAIAASKEDNDRLVLLSEVASCFHQGASKREPKAKARQWDLPRYSTSVRSPILSAPPYEIVKGKTPVEIKQPVDSSKSEGTSLHSGIQISIPLVESKVLAHPIPGSSQQIGLNDKTKDVSSHLSGIGNQPSFSNPPLNPRAMEFYSWDPSWSSNPSIPPSQFYHEWWMSKFGPDAEIQVTSP